MRYRKGIFFVVYKKEKKNLYLLLKRKLHWRGWEFPKAGLKKGEINKETVKRELKEETGLRAEKIKDFKTRGKWRYTERLRDRPGMIGQTWHLYGVEISKGKVRIDKKEHSAYRWLPYKEALKILTWPNQKRCLKIVNSCIKNGKF